MLSEARFEFRSFGQNFDNAAKRMARLSVPVPEEFWERSSDEIYIISQANDTYNAKIRDGKMDMKTLVQTVDGSEQWRSTMKGDFPMAVDVLQNEVFPAFQVTIPILNKQVYTMLEFIDIINEHSQLQAVKVHKQRFGYKVNNTICETGVVLINGAMVFTVNVESTEPDAIKKTIQEIGLEGVENINYLQAIKRVIGMINKPLAN